jgi:protocatechuate 3,4-dioxygenase beta subunit
MVLCQERVLNALAGWCAQKKAACGVGMASPTRRATFPSMWVRLTGAILIIATLLGSPSAHAGPVDAGIAWLTRQAQSDGSYSTPTDVATPFQATSETVRTLRLLGQSSTLAPAESFLGAEPYHGTEYLARKIIATVQAGGSAVPLVTELATHQNTDGGFGELSGYDSNPLDTGFALEALDAAGNADPNVVGNALGYLTSNQHADGGFASVDPSVSTVYATAIASHALQRYQLKFSLGPVIDAASRFLYAQQLAGGGWNTSWETALALLATVPVTTDPHLYANATLALSARQSANGDWDGSVYSTALALRAVNLTQNVTLPTNPSTGTLSGRVADQSSGQPLAGVQVTVSGATTGTATSDSNGQFSVAALSPGQYTVGLTLSGYTSASLTATVAAAQITDTGLTQLAPLPSTTVIFGTVTDSVTSQPIAGAVVQVTGTGNASATTGTNGQFRLAVLPGQVTVTVTATGYGSATGTVDSQAGSQLSFSPALVPVGSPPATQTSLVGKIVDSQSGAAIAGATIQLQNGGLTATSGADGTFSLTNITAGSYSAVITASGYSSVQVSFAVIDATRNDLGTLRLAQTAAVTSVTLSGVVQDAATGTPLSGARVSAGSVTSLTGADGHFLLTGINSLQFTLSAQASGYVGATSTFQVAQFGSYTTNIPLQPVTTPGLSIPQFAPGQPSYPAYAKADLTAQFANTADQPVSLQLVLQIQDEAGNEIGRIPAVHGAVGGAPADSLLTLAANTTLGTDFAWSTLNLPPGRYQLTLDAYDLNSLQLLAQRSTTVEILTTRSIPSLVLDPTPLYANVGANAQVQIKATVANRSNVPVDLAFTFTLVDPNGASVNSGNSTLTLQPQDAQSSVVVATFAYQFAVPGLYAITAQATGVVTPGVISGQKISVAPAIRIDPSESISPTTAVPDGDKRVHVNIQLKGVNP